MYGYAWMDGGDYEDRQIDVKLKIDKLDCNPPLALTKCVLSELFSWVSQAIAYNYYSYMIIVTDQSV